MRISVVDRLEFGDRQITSDGYLATVGKISRTGIYEYAGSEVGKPDMPIVRVYRDEAEVFDEEALRSFAYKPVTDGHPPVSVSATNWRTYARGQLGGKALRDKETVEFPMVLMDADLIKKVQDGTVELSAGYSASLEFTPGVSPKGEQYDAVMSEIRGNHAAVVKAGRAGSTCRIGDAWPDTIHPKKEPKNVTLMLDGLKVDLTDAEAVSVAFKKLTDARDASEKALTEAKEANVKAITDHKIALDAKDEAVKEKDAEIVSLKKQLEDAKVTPEKLRDAAASYAKVIEKAKALGITVADSMDETAIKRAVVDAKLGEAAKGWSDGEVNASFASFAAAVKDTAPVDPLRLALGNVVNIGDAKSEADKARAEMISGLTNRKAS